MPYAQMRDGARLHYLSLGRGPTTVVVLHGFAMFGALWLPFVAPLATRYRFILPDLRGFGGSHALPLNGRCLLSQHADDLADLFDHLGQAKVLLAGLSMGACTALQYQRRYGFDRVAAYLHIDQSPCVANRADWQHGLLGAAQAALLPQWRGLMEAMEEYRGQAFDAIPKALRQRLWQTLAVFFSHAMADGPVRQFSGLARHEFLVRRVAPVSNWPIYMDTLRSYLTEDYDWRSSLPQIQIPMTAFIGMRSSMYPAAGQLQLTRWVPHCRLVRFERSGHAIPFEAPLQFTQELSRWLATYAPLLSVRRQAEGDSSDAAWSAQRS